MVSLFPWSCNYLLQWTRDGCGLAFHWQHQISSSRHNSRLGFYSTFPWAMLIFLQISGDSTHLFGDGFAFWLTTERVSPGPVFGNKSSLSSPPKSTTYLINLRSVQWFWTHCWHVCRILRSNPISFCFRYANARHAYSFPRISGFLFDGSSTYDFGNDGDGQAAGACTVGCFLATIRYSDWLRQANVRRTNMATKLKVTYIKGEYLDVKVQYRACEYELLYPSCRVIQFNG